MDRAATRALLLCALACLQAAPGGAEILRLEILGRELFAGGQRFGEVGRYLRIAGVAHGKLDPEAARNAGIRNLRHAARDAEGRVDYAVDFLILRP